MPHADLKYSADLQIDAGLIMRRIEECINTHDAGAGACKGRAYGAEVFHHTHLLVEISLLPKPHRNAEFTIALRDDLEQVIKSCLNQPCAFSLALSYSDAFYITNRFEP